MPEAENHVVVSHPDRLHRGVADRAADEPEPQALEIPAHRIRLPGSGRHLGKVPPLVLARPAVHEAPKDLGKTPAPLAQGEQGAGVVDGCLYLQPVADDVRIREQPSPIQVTVAGDALRIETIKGPPITGPLAQNGDPGEPPPGRLRG